MYLEVLLATGALDRARAVLTDVVAIGLHDLAWLDRCPLVAPLRGEARFAELRAVVATRAATVGVAYDERLKGTP
jgi:serine/threonine-protein kinase